MTAHRQRTSSHSSQQSWGSTSGDSGLGDNHQRSGKAKLVTASAMPVQFNLNGHGHLPGSDMMVNGYYTPPLPRRKERVEGHITYSPARRQYIRPQGVDHPSEPLRERYSASKHHENGRAPWIQQQQTSQAGLSGRDDWAASPLVHARSVESSLNGGWVSSNTSGDSRNWGVQYTPPRHRSAHCSPARQPAGLSRSYDTTDAHVLDLQGNWIPAFQTRSEPRMSHHRASFHPGMCKLQTLESDFVDSPSLVPVHRNRKLDFGRSSAHNHLNGGDPMSPSDRRHKDPDVDSCHGSTPSSSTPSTPTSDATAHVVPNGYATLRGSKPSKFNLHTISENLSQIFGKSDSSSRHKPRNGHAGHFDDEILTSSQRLASAPVTGMMRRSSSVGNFLGLAGLAADDDSDEQNDDYGFLSPMYLSLHSSPSGPAAAPGTSNPVVSNSAAMNKASKSPTPAQRILPKKWRKSKLLMPGASVNKTPSLWKPKVSLALY